MTTPQIHRIADKPPEFPCWCFHPVHYFFNREVSQWVRWEFNGWLDKYCPTHWHPDQPTAPTVVPDAPTPQGDTPRTDEQINGKPCTRFDLVAGDSLRDALVPSEFARTLERELAEAKADQAEAEKWNQTHIDECNALRAELVEARKDRERLDWLEKQLENMDATKGGTWLRIGDNGRVQLHRYPLPHHAQHLVWHDEYCTLDSIPDHPVALRAAIDAAMNQPGAST